jgi:hypothetical protein
MDYVANLKLKHNEKLMSKVNVDTGEITDLKDSLVKRKRSPMKDKTMEYFDSDQPFHRHFTLAWKLLETQTSTIEYYIASKLGNRAEAYTNCLLPLSPESTAKSIAEELKIDVRSVSKAIDKLFKLGVIGKFEVYDRHEKHHNYWLFNPYLSFNGKGIKKDVATLFDRTTYAMFN